MRHAHTAQRETSRTSRYLLSFNETDMSTSHQHHESCSGACSCCEASLDDREIICPTDIHIQSEQLHGKKFRTNRNYLAF